MRQDAGVNEVFALLANRDLASLWPVYLLAKRNLASAVEPNALLALHEAILDSTDGLLTELAEHGLQNRDQFGMDPRNLDVHAMVNEFATSWEEAKRLREGGASSRELISHYVGDWMDPVGGRDWINRMRLALSQFRKPGWADRVSNTVRL